MFSAATRTRYRRAGGTRPREFPSFVTHLRQTVLPPGEQSDVRRSLVRDSRDYVAPTEGTRDGCQKPPRKSRPAGICWPGSARWRLVQAPKLEWVDGSEDGERRGFARRWSRPAPSSPSTRKSGPIPISPGPIPPMSPGSRTHLHLLDEQGRCRPDQQLGAAGGDARDADAACSTAACAAARCT